MVYGGGVPSYMEIIYVEVLAVPLLGYTCIMGIILQEV